MNVGNIASNAASSAASGAASNVASNAASNVASGATQRIASNNAANAVNGTSALTPKNAPNPIDDNIIQFPGNSNHQKTNINSNSPSNDSSLNADENGNSLDNQQKESNIENPNESDKNKPKEEKQKQKNDNEYQAQSNQDVGPGKKIDENGNVVNTGTRKSVEAIGRGVAAYASGGKSIGNEDIITKNPIGDKALGVVADTADKVPIAGKVLDDLGENGVADGVNDALDTIGKAEKGDIKGAVDSAKKTKKDIAKIKKKYGPRLFLIGFSALFPLIMVCIIIGAICGPVLGGFMDITNAAGEFVSDVGDFLTGETSSENTSSGISTPENLATTEQLLSDVPSYNSLSLTRQGVLAAAASGIASGRPYHIRMDDNDPCWGKPTGPGLDGIPACGIDCSGFVQWSLWTATGNKPFSGGTATMASSIGGIFEEISESELQPGDFALKHKASGGNHTGIYAGNGMWYHAANSTDGIIRSKNPGFTVFLRYKGIDD